VRTIVDTGPLVALLNRNDQHHGWTLQALERLTPPLWTCEPVLTETAYLTGRGWDLLEMLSEGRLRIGLELENQADGVAALLRRFSGRMDLADACVVRLSELTKRCQVFTTDYKDFSIYRRNGREMIPLLVPPR